MIILTRQVDQWVQIGDDLFVCPTDIDRQGVRLLARGRMLGGPDDGATLYQTTELGVGSEMRLGHASVTAVEVHGDAVRLGISAPRGISVHKKEVADKIKRAGGDRQG